MVKYKAIFFDLDHTLWDYDTNSEEVLSEIFDEHVSGSNTDLAGFLKNFTKVNDKLWDRYNKGEIDKEVIRKERFVKILEYSDIDNRKLAEEISEYYLFECPRRTHLVSGAIEILDYVNEKYDMHILTNGFTDVQQIKMERAGIEKYFKHVITSESVGHKKPSKEIFEYALKTANVEVEEALMIGDNLKTDIAGAHNAGMDSMYFNPSAYAKPHKAKFEVNSLDKISNIL